MKVKNCTPEELQQFPSRLALTDAMKHMGWMVQKYETLEHEFPDLAWNSIMVTLSNHPQQKIRCLRRHVIHQI